MVIVIILLTIWLVYSIPEKVKKNQALSKEEVSSIRVYVSILSIGTICLFSNLIDNWNDKRTFINTAKVYTAELYTYSIKSGGSGRSFYKSYRPVFTFRTVTGDSIIYKPKSTVMKQPAIGTTYKAFHSEVTNKTVVMDEQNMIGISILCIIAIVSTYLFIGNVLYSVFGNLISYRWIDINMAIIISAVAFVIGTQMFVIYLFFSGLQYFYAVVIIYLLASFYMLWRQFKNNIHNWLIAFNKRK
ncbi:hypothetical protein HMPREF9713_02363 [Myroides odoratimimus CCUG 12700]|uniref:hypothetical protein n=1 Tax=Myroides odoratimimus TaxID=76832 RepID=UPI0003535A1E|nr:hypothetical protein [Myroides odoratimimus]EPH10551.1 hypothetical protein HMPREF9713_02363 [Myroides odoratimimus CCUG 12700]